MECLSCTARFLRLSSALRQELHILPPNSRQQFRHESTARRLRSKQRIPPAASSTAGPDHTASHIIYAPPSSLPNIYHTPPVFLPHSDPRRPKRPTASPTKTMMAATTTAPAEQSLQALALSHLPLLDRPHARKYHLTPSDVAEIRKLRAADHRTWTVKRLATKFDCSEAFVRLCAHSEVAKQEQDARIAEAKARWGRTKREAREDRERRKELWGMEP